MTIEDEDLICRIATARQMILDLNKAFEKLAQADLAIDLQIENVVTMAQGYKTIKTPRIILRVWKEIE